MTNRATVSAPRIIVATMMASAALVTGQLHVASAADDCIAKPKESPAGKHWFYRIDRATKRQCWYLRDTTSQGASLEVRKSAAASHKAHAAFSPSAENAHAELASASTAKDDDVKSAPVAAAPPTVAAPPAVAALPNMAAPAASSPAAAAETSTTAQQPPDSSGGTADQSAIAARWPDQMDQVAPVVATPRAPTFAVASAAPASNSDAAPMSPAAPVAPAATVGLSAAGTETAANSSGLGADVPDRSKLLVFLGAVALVGFSFSVLLGRARSRRRIRLAPAVARRATRWPAEPEIDRMRLPSVNDYYPTPIPVSDGTGGARRASIVPRDEEGRDEEFDVEQMLARYAGQARTHR